MLFRSLAALQPGIRQGMAQGGYINLQPMGELSHPQALIPRAQPYAAAAPQRREVVQNFDRGGLINGEGDGMSDDIDAHIEGQEPVKVADGEYLIPKEVAAKYGPEKLKAMMAKVRAAAHAKKGKQVFYASKNAGRISGVDKGFYGHLDPVKLQHLEDSVEVIGDCGGNEGLDAMHGHWPE
mgnify:CR=1 FL=1